VGPNASAVSYAWYEDHNTSAQRKLGEGPRVNATLPLGSHDVTLVIRLQREVTVTNETDGNVTTYQANETLLDTLTVEVVDTTAPVITATASRASLWPPNHKLVPIEVEVHVEDVCAPSPSWSLASATSDEDADGKGDGHTAVDLLDVQPGTQDTSFQLRSERAGSGDGRAYTLTYEARDPSGNVVRKDVVVSVPHDMG
jgi:hypothetical protein